MRRPVLAWAALVGLAVLPAVARAAESTADKPAFVVRVASIDRLLEDLRFLSQLADKEDDVRNLEGVLKNLGGPEGLKGVDTTKPLGLYGHIGPQGVPDSNVVALIPVKDEKALLEFVADTLSIQPEKGADGVYTVNLNNLPVPIYARFTDGYCYISNAKQALGKERLAPADVLPEGKIGVLWVTLEMSQIPDKIKQLALGRLDLDLAREKDKPSRSRREGEVRGAVLDGVSARVKSLFRDGGALDFHLELDRSRSDFSLTLSVTPKSGTDLARRIHSLEDAPSLGAALVAKDSALNARAHLVLPREARAALMKAFEDAKKHAAEARSEKEREIARKLMDSLEPTVKAGELDAGFDIRGPNDDGLYTVVAGIKVKDGEGIDKALHEVYKELPEDAREHLKLDAEKAGDVSIHRIKPDKQDKDAQKMLGDGPIYVAVRGDAILLAAGDKALDAIKEAIAAEPRPGNVLHLEASVLRLSPLMEKDHPGAAEAAKKVFKEKGSDRVVLSLQGGDTLQLHLRARTQLIKFGRLIDKSKKDD
jgi:hypothetical protein